MAGRHALRRARRPLAFMAGSSVTQAANLALSAVLASRLLGPHDRGLMVLGASSASLAALVAGLGTGSALRARLPTLPDGPVRHRLLTSYAWWSAVAGVGAGCLAAVVSLLCGPTIDSGLTTPAFLVAVLTATAGYTAMTQFPDAWYAAGQFRPGSAWGAATATGGVAGIVVAALLHRSAWALLLGQACGMIVVAFVQAVRLHRVGLLPVGPPDRQETGYLLRSGVQSLGLTLGLALALRADRYVLGAVAGAGAVGIYSIAATLSEAPKLIPAALGQITYREVALGCDPARIRCTQRKALLAALGSGLLVGTGGWLLIVPVFGAPFAGARPLLLVLLVAEVLFAPFAVASRGLLGGGWMTTAGLVGAAGMVGSVLLFALAIPAWGTFGAAGASLVAYAGLSVTSVVLLRRRMRRAVARADTVVIEAVPAADNLVPADAATGVSRHNGRHGHPADRHGHPADRNGHPVARNGDPTDLGGPRETIWLRRGDRPGPERLAVVADLPHRTHVPRHARAE